MLRAVVALIRYTHAKYDRLLMKGDFSSFDQFLLPPLSWLTQPGFPCARCSSVHIASSSGSVASIRGASALVSCNRLLNFSLGSPDLTAGRGKARFFFVLVPCSGLPASRAGAAPKYSRPGCKKSRRVDLSKQLRAVLLELLVGRSAGFENSVGGCSSLQFGASGPYGLRVSCSPVSDRGVMSSLKLPCPQAEISRSF